jgi:hypothetical protein
MKFKIKGRDIKFFILGVFAAFIFSMIYDWQDNVKAFKNGFEDGVSGKAFGTSK